MGERIAVKPGAVSLQENSAMHRTRIGPNASMVALLARTPPSPGSRRGAVRSLGCEPRGQELLLQ